MHGSFGDEYDLALEVKVPISPPLPGQSNGGLPRSLGHWGVAKVAIRFRHFIWIEDLIQMIEETIGRSRWGISSSCAGEASELLQEVVGGEENEILTAATSVEAAPEDSLTAAASLHPLFSMSVENITKALGHTLSDHPDISWFSVTVENLADGYSVFSSLEWPSRAS
jgi:GTP cyclohydrolase I